jgi:CDP-paratose 2-epimerase
MIAHAPRRNDGPSGEGRPALITGGAGFIGTNLAVRLLESGRRVIVYDNLSRAGTEQNAKFLARTYEGLADVRTADIRDARALDAAAAEAGEIYHFAAQVAVTTSLQRPDEDCDINIAGTMAVLEAVRRLDRPCPLLFTSTNKVYGNLADVELVFEDGRYRPADRRLAASGIGELRPLAFCSPYGCSKGAADQYVLDYAASYGLPTCVFRMSCIYGPHQHGNSDQGWLAHFIRTAAVGGTITIYGDGGQVRDALYADDLVDAMLLARDHIDELTGRAFNIGGGPGNTISLLELLGLIGRLDGRPPRTERAEWRVGDQRWYVSDTSGFRAATGWRPRVGVTQGVARLHQWLSRDGRAAPDTVRPEVLTP